ncbi:UDP-N-acetylmuramate--L-alanine ligase [Pleurocapsales cyanobacterium LEGE 06147]|nr:UDP-N-acetylmuramate--L-alanine ligase [Pleurocapsales cyanobacterium LEGE 06147]
MKTVDLSGRPFHFIGIGGIGMSALAYVVAKRQLPVSGSDLRPNHITERLKSLGAHIFSRQEAANLTFFLSPSQSRCEPASAVLAGSSVGEKSTIISRLSDSFKDLSTSPLPQVICSTAIEPTNLEYRAAVEMGCPIFHRSDLLAALIQNYQSIAVSGTHGKTTTSSLIGYLLLMTGLDPTIIVGGEVDAWQGNARVGESNFLVAEADESDGSLIKHSPAIGVVTNIELDHPDHYQNVEEVVKIFQLFGEQCGTLIGCLDDDNIRQNLELSISYSLNPATGADYTVKNIHYHAWGSTARVWERGAYLGDLQVQLLGKHNLSNALAAVAVGRKLGLEFPVIAEAIARFEGTKRRFEQRGEANGIVFIDDYAHHPSEIKATLGAARLRVDEDASFQRVVAVFQPHRYSRTQAFIHEFATAFGNADIVIVTDIYSAGEENVNGISGEHLAQAIAQHHPQVHYHPSLSSLSSFLQQQILQPGDLALFLGAGNLNQQILQILALY